MLLLMLMLMLTILLTYLIVNACVLFSSPDQGDVKRDQDQYVAGGRCWKKRWKVEWSLSEGNGKFHLHTLYAWEAAQRVFARVDALSAF